MEAYNPKKIEAKWQGIWEERGMYRAEDSSSKEKLYVLDMFPYPSGEGLHVGHVGGYTATDIYSRFKRMQGFNVLHPMGWDSFGLPAENYAIKAKVHPRITTERAITNFRRQIKSLGLSYDWTREIGTHTPEYYRWTQWFFLLLYKNGLAYRAKAKVNWCESCKTVLANEQVVDGLCERCGSGVIQKDLEQWFFKITDFADALISDLDAVDWPASTKLNQRNWIGRSEGAEIEFGIKNSELGIKVFTTRADTLFGATYVVLSPEHELLANKELRIKNWDEVVRYIVQSGKKTELERLSEGKEKTGVKLEGVLAVNPGTKEEIPIFVADYVLATYGTGAIMAVPAHDKRDWEFADYIARETGRDDLGLVRHVIEPVRVEDLVWDANIPENKRDGRWEEEQKRELQNALTLLKSDNLCYPREGVLVRSGEFSGLTSEEGREKIAARFGVEKVTYKLRDWLISRQRYWGAPIPIIYCEKCGEVPVPEEDLPILLPDDVDFIPTGASPLARSESFH